MAKGKGKRYWWAKLMSDYFERIEIKQLRSMPGGIGDVLCVIALKIQLYSLQNNGLILYKGVCDDMVEEIALAVNEDAKNVKMAMDWLQRHHWATPVDSGYVITMLEWGSEGESAERMRKYRAAMEPASHCAHNVTTEQRTEKIRKEQEQDSVVDMSDEQEVIDKWGVGEMVRALAAEGYDQSDIHNGLMLLNLQDYAMIKKPWVWLRKAVINKWRASPEDEKRAVKKAIEAKEIAAARAALNEAYKAMEGSLKNG